MFLAARSTKLIGISRAATGFIVALLLLSGCVVSTPEVETTNAPAPTNAPLPTAAFQESEPTAPPPPTAPPAPTPEPTTPPEPTPLPGPTVAPPIPTVDASDPLGLVTQPAGPITIPVGPATFVLGEARPVLQLGGHTLIYVDDDQMAEVDIFTPTAQRDGTTFDDYDQLITYLETDADFAGLEELDEVTIAGLPTRVFEGTLNSEQRGFFTDSVDLDAEFSGWFPPARVRMWVIDVASGPIIVTAESLEDPGQYTDAIRLASEILSTIDFG